MTEKPIMIITGVADEIGNEIAYYYVQDYHIISCGEHSCDLLEKYGYDYTYNHYKTDITDETQVKNFFHQLGEDFSNRTPRVLINCFEVNLVTNFFLTSAESAIDVMKKNYISSFNMNKEFARIANDSARIINFSATSVALSLEGNTAYACSKSAVEQLTKNLAKEISPKTVNCIGLSPIETKGMKKIDERWINNILDRQAIRRFGTFKDIINIIDFLIKPESGFITGQVIEMGGLS